MDDALALRPTLAAWLAEYDEIENDYIQRLRRAGVGRRARAQCRSEHMLRRAFECVRCLYGRLRFENVLSFARLQPFVLFLL